jgi:Family of unknown function (DUF5681)
MPRKLHPNSLANLKPFQPGVSGNPGGRRKKPITDEVLKKLLEIRRKKSRAERIAEKIVAGAEKGKLDFINVALDRSEGKPLQGLRVEDPEGALGAGSKTPDELIESINALTESIRNRIRESNRKR